MISAGRCSGCGGGGSGGSTAIASKDCRAVNGGVDGYVEHCEQASDAKNKMVMAASKITVDTGGDKNTSVITSTTVNNRVLPLTGPELDGLKDYTLTNIKLIENLNMLLTKKNEKIVELTNEVTYLKHKWDEAHQRIAELEARNESLDVLPFTPVSSTCLSGMDDLSSAKLPNQQEVKPKKRRGRPVVIKQSRPDPLEVNQAKWQITISSRANSANLGKMQEVSLITSSSMGDLSSAELPEQQKVKPKKRRGRPVVIKQPSTDPLETNQAKWQRTISNRAKSGEMQEVSLITSSSMGDLSPAELPEQQEVKPKRRRGCPVVIKQPNPDPLKTNQAKWQGTTSNRAQSGEMQEVSLITSGSIGDLSSAALPEQEEVKPIKRRGRPVVIKQPSTEMQEVSLITSDSMGDLSSAGLPKQQEVKPKKRRSHQVVITQPSPDALETNQAKWQRTTSNRAQSADLGKTQELSLITFDSVGDLSSAEIPEQQEVKPKKRRGRQVINQPGLDPLETNQAKWQKTIKNRAKSADLVKTQEVSLITSDSIGDLSSAELPEQQEVKRKKRKSSQVVITQPGPDALETNQAKWQRTTSNRAKSADLVEMQEVSLITSDKAYYTCLGNYDPINDPEKPQFSLQKGILEGDLNNLEIPSWRIKTYSRRYSMEGTENMSDDIFRNRHSRLEVLERKQKKWDMQRIRELRQIECLKEGRNKYHLQNFKGNKKEELTTLLPNSAHIKAIEITENLPVSAFGCNLYTKKEPESFKFFHSQWYNDGSSNEVSQEKNVRGLRSSDRGEFNDTLREF